MTDRLAGISGVARGANVDNQCLTNNERRSNMQSLGSKAAGYLWDDAWLSPTHPCTRSGFGSETVGYLLSTPAVTHTSEALR
jgi:hypothetical protein